MADTLKPNSDEEVEDAIKSALAAERTIEVIGNGSKRPIGRAAQWDQTLDLSQLSGVTLYEPEELVLSAKAGTPLAEIETLLDSRNQQLAFEPMDYGPVLGLPAQRGTIGGMVASNLSGPRRIKTGAARDHFLGFTAVSGRGETFKSGSRVVKNVTGYDLPKLLAGSWGTLAVMTSVTLKVLPKPETEQTAVLFGLDDRRAVRAMSAALGSAGEVSAAAHLPLAAVTALPPPRPMKDAPCMLLRLEGVDPSIRHRLDVLRSVLRDYGTLAVIGADDSRMLWRQVRDVIPFAADTARPLWRVSVAPMQGPDCVDRIRSACDASYFYDWAGGLIWLQLDSPADAQADLIHSAAAALGGHATLVRATPSIRAFAEIFQPLNPVLAGITKRIKDGFDPKRILNPGRMYAGV
jgi:glycolate oxidase FAD binding subunit